MKLLIGLVVLACLAGGAALLTIYLGLPDIAASTPHWSITRWALSTTMENGVRRRAAGIPVPADLSSPARIQEGASHYAEMCATCHAAPGVSADELAKGLLPPPPKLQEAVSDWTPAELFWITKHGVRMTGMAAFGATHSDEKIWDMVAFMEQLPKMSPTEYRSLTAHAAAEHDEEEPPS